jgi:hypothetical protein
MILLLLIPINKSIVRYGTEPGKLTEETVGWHVKVPIEISRYVCHVQLQLLAPDTTFYFVAGTVDNIKICILTIWTGADAEHLTVERMFRTATADPNSPVHFVAGGDMGAYANTVKVDRCPMAAYAGELTFASAHKNCGGNRTSCGTDRR